MVSRSLGAQQHLMLLPYCGNTNGDCNRSLFRGLHIQTKQDGIPETKLLHKAPPPTVYFPLSPRIAARATMKTEKGT